MKVKNQDGISLIQLLLISVALAGMALVGTNMLSDQKKTQKGSQTTDDINLLHQMVTSVLQDKKHCSATLLRNMASGHLTSGWKAVTNPGPLLDKIYLAQIDAGGAQSARSFIRTATPYMNGNITIGDIRVDFPQQRFSIEYIKINSGSTSSKSITKFVDNITFKIDSGIDTCYADAENVNTSTAQEFCLSLGSLFVWNAATKDCSLANHVCADPDTVFVGIRSDGETICKKTGQYTDWANLIDTSSMCDATAPGVTVRLEYSGGRIRLICTP